MKFEHQRLIVGYHGCDEEVVTKVLAGNESLKPSENTFDWMGKGIYFWEYGPHRAFDFAKEQKRRDEKNDRTIRIHKPDVLGAYINLGTCLDLADREATKSIQEFYPEFEAVFK